MGTQNEEVVVDDRRATIEAAFDAEESKVEVPSTPETEKQLQAPEKAIGETEKTPTTPEAKPVTEAKVPPVTEEKPVNTDKPPQSWKPAQKAKWEQLDPDIRQEVLRRDREITQTLSQTAQARQIASTLQETLTPFMERFQQLEAHPMVAIRELLKADQILNSGSKQEAAAKMAELIRDYDIDIVELDHALAGKGPADPVEAKVQKLLEERLAPVNQFVQSQRQAQMEAEQRSTQAVTETVESMAADTEKYPYFEQVRDSMADIVEIMARRGQQITIEAAYNKAVALDPTLSEELSAKAAAEASARKAAELNSKAQRALAASVSVGGAPKNSTSGAPVVTDRRATIEAAFDALSGR